MAAALNLLDDRRAIARETAANLLHELQEQEKALAGRLIGITGPPGAGKSSLTAALISVWRARGLRVGVLAVDPSSPVSGGALLGDRLRMQTSSDDDCVFVRSLSSRGEFGGISAEVWPMSQVMLAAFDVVVVETVGVGQREIDIANMCDTTCFVAQPGSGDGVQSLKAGILEVPHIVVVNKEDMGAVATRTLAELTATLGKEHAEGHWQVPVLSTSATLGSGIEAFANAIEQHHNHLLKDDSLVARRRSYQAQWIIKRLVDEFGRYGIGQLGGEEVLLERLLMQDSNLLAQYESLKEQLSNDAGGSKH